MKRAYVALVVGAATSALAAAAHAICGGSPYVEVLPSLSVPGPPNAHVRLKVSSPSWERQGFCEVGRPASGCAQGGDFDLQIRRPASVGRAPLVVPAARAHSSSGTFAFEELVGAAFEPGAYEVWSVERQNKTRDRLIAAFEIRGAPDVTPPRWGGIRRGAYRPADRGVTVECGHEVAAFDVDLPSDDATPLAALRVAVWTSAPASPIDYGKPALLVTTIDMQTGAPRVLLGNTDASTDFIPDGVLRTVNGMLDWDHTTVPLRFGMKVVDLAGNASAQSETVLL